MFDKAKKSYGIAKQAAVEKFKTVKNIITSLPSNAKKMNSGNFTSKVAEMQAAFLEMDKMNTFKVNSSKLSDLVKNMPSSIKNQVLGEAAKSSTSGILKSTLKNMNLKSLKNIAKKIGQKVAKNLLKIGSKMAASVTKKGAKIAGQLASCAASKKRCIKALASGFVGEMAIELVLGMIDACLVFAAFPNPIDLLECSYNIVMDSLGDLAPDRAYMIGKNHVRNSEIRSQQQCTPPTGDNSFLCESSTLESTPDL